MSNNIYSNIGLCQTSGNLVSGEILLEAIKNNTVHYVLICNDASDNTKKKIINKCNYYHVEYTIYGTIEDLSQSLGKHRVAIGIKSDGFIKLLKSDIGG